MFKNTSYKFNLLTSRLSRLRLRIFQLHFVLICRRMYHAGFLGFQTYENEQREMERTARTLHYHGKNTNQGDFNVPICMMSGSEFWYQTSFCLNSVRIQSGCIGRVQLYDDGSLTNDHITFIRNNWPETQVYGKKEMDTLVEEQLPITKYPNIHEWRSRRPLLKKIVDIQLMNPSWNLFLDSDMLFYRRPLELEAWLKSPTEPLYQTDCGNFYGYSFSLIQSLVKRKIPKRLNIGIWGMRGDLCDWDQIEYWIGKLYSTEGPRYNITQCLAAMVMSSQTCHALNPKDYLVLPSKKEARFPTAVLHHYVSFSKPFYFKWGWRRILDSGNR